MVKIKLIQSDNQPIYLTLFSPPAPFNGRPGGSESGRGNEKQNGDGYHLKGDDSYDAVAVDFEGRVVKVRFKLDQDLLFHVDDTGQGGEQTPEPAGIVWVV